MWLPLWRGPGSPTAWILTSYWSDQKDETPAIGIRAGAADHGVSPSDRALLGRIGPMLDADRRTTGERVRPRGDFAGGERVPDHLRRSASRRGGRPARAWAASGEPLGAGTAPARHDDVRLVPRAVGKLDRAPRPSAAGADPRPRHQAAGRTLCDSV